MSLRYCYRNHSRHQPEIATSLPWATATRNEKYLNACLELIDWSSSVMIRMRARHKRLTHPPGHPEPKCPLCTFQDGYHVPHTGQEHGRSATSSSSSLPGIPSMCSRASPSMSAPRAIASITPARHRTPLYPHPHPLPVAPLVVDVWCLHRAPERSLGSTPHPESAQSVSQSSHRCWCWL